MTSPVLFWIEMIGILVVCAALIVIGLLMRRKLDPKKKAVGAIMALLGGIILMLVGSMVLLSYMIAQSINA